MSIFLSFTFLLLITSCNTLEIFQSKNSISQMKVSISEIDSKRMKVSYKMSSPVRGIALTRSLRREVKDVLKFENSSFVLSKKKRYVLIKKKNNERFDYVSFSHRIDERRRPGNRVFFSKKNGRTLLYTGFYDALPVYDFEKENFEEDRVDLKMEILSDKDSYIHEDLSFKKVDSWISSSFDGHYVFIGAPIVGEKNTWFYDFIEQQFKRIKSEFLKFDHKLENFDPVFFISHGDKEEDLYYRRTFKKENFIHIDLAGKFWLKPGSKQKEFLSQEVVNVFGREILSRGNHKNAASLSLIAFLAAKKNIEIKIGREGRFISDARYLELLNKGFQKCIIGLEEISSLENSLNHITRNQCSLVHSFFLDKSLNTVDKHKVLEKIIRKPFIGKSEYRKEVGKILKGKSTKTLFGFLDLVSSEKGISKNFENLLSLLGYSTIRPEKYPECVRQQLSHRMLLKQKVAPAQKILFFKNKKIPKDVIYIYQNIHNECLGNESYLSFTGQKDGGFRYSCKDFVPFPTLFSLESI